LAFYLIFAAIALARGEARLVSEGGGVGYDFACFWGAGRLALAGQALAAYDWGQLKGSLDREMAFGGNPLQFPLPFFYPPTFLLVLGPLALLPFAVGLAVWLVATLAAYLAMLRAILPGPTALITALAAPPVFITLWVGQNGLLTAALVGGTLALLDRRPLASGALLGLLVYKPHFGVLFPMVLAATGRWRAFAAAALTIAALAGITGLLFGWEIFPAAASALLSAGQYNLVSGTTPWFKLQSVYGMLRAAGVDSAAAGAAHGTVAVAAALATLLVWRSRQSNALKAASLATAMLLLPPYVAIYDLPLLTVPLAFLVRDGLESGFRPRERLALALALASCFALTFAFSFVREPVGPAACACLAAVIALRLRPALTARAAPGLAAS
jgi:hypothetical protein